MFCSQFGIDANLLGYVIDETDICKLGSLKSKFGGIFILKWLFVLLNVENSFELLDTLRFEIIFPSILWIFSLMVDGTPGSKGNCSNIELVNLMFIEFNSLQFNLKYVGF